ncbi:MAG: NAD(P)/FAD-dependent oxidoreductase [Pseudomonadota bacterium]|nr:NAD(P)/FAD-dependent oxidoreductase [Pseudomonadota bacterium]
MDMAVETSAGKVDEWLKDLVSACSEYSSENLKSLFFPDCHWRDLLAFTWHITTFSGPERVVPALLSAHGDFRPVNFRRRGTPDLVTRGGRENIVEGIFEFDTDIGKCQGVVRLCVDAEDQGKLKAWTLLTALDQIRGFEETVGAARPKGEVYGRNFSGPNWLDKRHIAVAYKDREPEVLVVGGGQAGLSIAARLTQLGVDTLVVDREERVGDNWRKRYHSLVLHNQVHVNHLPYLPFPPSWPTYIPKDKLASWFEFYAEAMELNFWTETEFVGGRYDESKGRWNVTLKNADGAVRELRPSHVVMATSVSGIAKLPEIPTLSKFCGEIIHSSEYKGANGRKGANFLVLGTGTSAHDIAQDLHSNGVKATLLQRNATSVLNVEPSAQLPYTLYDEGHSLEDADLIATATPFTPLKRAHELLTEEATRLDKNLLEGLAGVGFKIDREDRTGWQFKYMTRGGGYYFNVGCSDLIINGDVGLIQLDDVNSFVPDGVQLKNGEVIPFDTIVLATGFKGMEALVHELLGEKITERVGPIWGFDENKQELRNMWVRTPQPGLWFIAGSFAQCRIYSKYLGLQIKACLENLIGIARN